MSRQSLSITTIHVVSISLIYILSNIFIPKVDCSHLFPPSLCLFTSSSFVRAAASNQLQSWKPNKERITFLAWRCFKCETSWLQITLQPSLVAALPSSLAPKQRHRPLHNFYCCCSRLLQSSSSGSGVARAATRISPTKLRLSQRPWAPMRCQIGRLNHHLTSTCSNSCKQTNI